jgi:hypothetical protein
MLPAWRTAGEGFALPACDVVPSDVEGFMEENIRELKVHDPLTGGALLMVVSGDCPPGSRHGLPRGRPRGPAQSFPLSSRHNGGSLAA